jgi:coatomer subunit beta
MQLCLRILTQKDGMKQTSLVEKVLIEEGKAIFKKFLSINSNMQARVKRDDDLLVTQPDEKIVFRQLKQKGKTSGFDESEEVSNPNAAESFLSEIKGNSDQRIYQLTGYSDPIYAETIAEVHHYDILLKIVLMNRTQKTIQNIACELVTQGNLKVVEKPINVTLRAGESRVIKSSLKVNSTDNGAIYGYLTFDSASGNLPHIININEIQIDFINALTPADCPELEFKLKWAEYEWENKVHVNTPITDLKQYVEHFAKEMNIKLMTNITDQD